MSSPHWLSPLLISLLGLVQAVLRPPTFVLDLALPPVQRWEGAVELILDAHGFDDSFGSAFSSHNDSLFDHLLPSHYAMFTETLERFWPTQAVELQGLSEQFRRNGHYVSYQYLCAWVYFHELAHTPLADVDRYSSTAAEKKLGRSGRECTGILLKAPDGSVIHARNMDQSPRTVRNVTLQIRVVHGEREIFSAVDWYWFTTGMVTAVKRGVLSIQENWRFGTQDTSKVLADIAKGVIPQVFVFRDLLARGEDPSSSSSSPPTTSFAEILHEVETRALISPYYVVLAGAGGEGAVVTRNTTGSEETLLLSQGGHTTSNDTWFLAQTNYDHWLPDPPTDPRRTQAEATLRNLGQTEACSQLGAFAVVSTYPVHNMDTAYTAIMNARTGELHAYVRAPMCPVDTFGRPLPCQ